jgi:hypothetical protein
MAQGSFHGCCMRMRHRVDAAARPNLYPDWPETPEHASIVVNHTARTHVYLGASAYCFYGSPVLDLGRYVLPSPPIPSLLPSPSFQCGAADFTGRKHHLVCIRSFDSIAALGGAFFFFTYLKHFPRSQHGRGRPFLFCIPYSNNFWGARSM